MTEEFISAWRLCLVEQRRHLIAQVKAIELFIDFLDQQPGATKVAGKPKKGYNYGSADADSAIIAP